MNIKSYFSTTYVTTCSVGSFEVFPILLGIIGFIYLTGWLGLACRPNPAFLLTMLFSTMMIIMVIFFRLTFSSFVRISSVLSQFLNPTQLLLLLSYFLLFSKFLLFFELIVLFLFLFTLAVLHGRIHAIAVMVSANSKYTGIFCY